jgi:centromere protein C
MSAQQEKDLSEVVEKFTNRGGPPKGRSLYILKRETANDQTALHTRSGRASVRPLAYWRNERCVYGDGEAELGQRFPLSTIKEIIRADDVEPETTRHGKRKASKKSKSRKKKDDDSDGDNMDNADPWETELGILHGYIRKWNPETQSGTREEEILGRPPISLLRTGPSTDF